MTAALNTTPNRQHRTKPPMDCPLWCDRIHDEKPDEIVMHETVPTTVTGRSSLGRTPAARVTLQLNRVLDEPSVQLYVAGDADLDLAHVRKLRDRLNEFLILMGAGIESVEQPIHALVEASLNADGTVADRHAFQALEILANQATASAN